VECATYQYRDNLVLIEVASYLWSICCRAILCDPRISPRVGWIIRKGAAPRYRLGLCLQQGGLLSIGAKILSRRAHLFAVALDVVVLRYLGGGIGQILPPHRTGAMQDAEYGLPRTPLLGTW
jgi:hypothetical protein